METSWRSVQGGVECNHGAKEGLGVFQGWGWGFQKARSLRRTGVEDWGVEDNNEVAFRRSVRNWGVRALWINILG